LVVGRKRGSEQSCFWITDFFSIRGENLKAWEMRIAANSCRDMLRSRLALPAISLNSTPTDSEDSKPSAIDLPSGLPSPGDLAEHNKLRRTIVSDLAGLS